MDVVLYLQRLKSELFSAEKWRAIAVSSDWLNQFPADAGVYAIRQKSDKTIIYIGETGSIQGRLNDLLNSQQHSARRSLGHKLYKNMEGYERATTSKKFPDMFEALLNDHMAAELEISYVVVHIGRKELEEFIVSELDTTTCLNRRGKRGAKIL